MSDDIGLSVLKGIYPWPTVRPKASDGSVSEEGWGKGWPLPENIIGSNLSEETRLVIELGTWLGNSARFILKYAPNATVICIDHWNGSPEHSGLKSSAEMIPTLYEDFLSICWEDRDRLIPVRETTLKGMKLIAELCLVPDLIFIDAAHDYESVKADLEMANRLFPEATIIGDDYLGVAICKDDKPIDIDYGVRRAVNHFIYERGWGLRNTGRGWQLIRKPSSNGRY